MRRPIQTILLTALVSSAATLALLRWDLIPEFPRRPSGLIEPNKAAAAGQAALSADEETNIRVYRKVSPGVVNITSRVVEYGFFFQPYWSEGTGSGMVLDIDGNILTNYHVIADARELEVALPDQTKYRAQRVGGDSINDLAVIRLVNCPKDRLHPVSLGDSNDLKVGQKVLAIGNPYRLQNTLTIGIISSLGRIIQNENGEKISNIIQTDAAINPGNSGGPLLNTSGEMVGINTMIYSPSGGNVGIGFAVPANTVRRVVNDLLKYGHVQRPSLDVEGYTITEDLSSALGLPVNRGILVAKVGKGSAADQAGIKGASQIALLYNERILTGGDIITHIDGKPVASGEDLRLALEDKKPGDTVTLTIYRGHNKMDKQVQLNESRR